MKKRFDLIVLGATGFTGKYVAKYLQTFHPGLRWAIAGRNQSKLQVLADELGGTSNKPAILLADNNSKDSMISAFRDSSVVINCTGPYRFLGEQVVDACIEAGTDYMDISGEPQFMETSFLKYHKKAVDKNVLVLHSCAFDSVPADFGVWHAMQQFEPGCCASVESFFDVHAKSGFTAHATTYDCAVHGFGDADAVRQVRKDIQSTYSIPKISYLGPDLPKGRESHHFETRLGTHVVPFMGADVSVVRSSQRSLAMMTGVRTWPSYAHYACVTNIDTVLRYRNIFGWLAQYPMGRKLLLRYPSLFSGGVFTHKGPTAEQVANTSFDFHIFARGYSSKDKRGTEAGNLCVLYLCL